MTEAELLARIEGLERENEELRASKIYRPRRAICPLEIGTKYGGKHLRNGYADSCIGELPFMYNADLNALSLLIRTCCFHSVKRKQARRGGGTVYTNVKKKTDEMSDEEYAKYCEILDGVLGVIAKYAINKEDRSIMPEGENR